MCDRLQRGEYGQQSELALIACKYNVEIIVFENGTQQLVQKPTGTHQQKQVTASGRLAGIFKTWTKFHGR